MKAAAKSEVRHKVEAVQGTIAGGGEQVAVEEEEEEEGKYKQKVSMTSWARAWCSCREPREPGVRRWWWWGGLFSKNY